MPVGRSRRAVERANRRQSITDRVVAGLLVVVAASGLMTVLPGSSQRAVARRACQVGSLGLAACASPALVLGTGRLRPPRCAILAGLDQVLPEVRVNRLVTADGLTVETTVARSGDAVLTAGTAPEPDPPLLLDGEPRSLREVAPGTRVPAGTAWRLPGGQGADAVVEALQDSHRRHVQQRSALAVLSATLDGDGRRVPPPTLLWSRVRLDANVLPHLSDAPRPPSTDGPGSPRRGGPTSSGQVRLITDRPAVARYDNLARTSSVTADLAGEVTGGGPLSGALSGSVRWTRDADGAVTSVLYGIVSPGPLVRGETEPVAGATTVLTYVAVPVRTAAERALVERWLSDARGLRLDLGVVLDLRTPDVGDQLGSFLSRAATVTVLRPAGLDVAAAERQVHDELVRDRRLEAPAGTLLGVGVVAPRPDMGRRTLTTDPGCVRP